MRVCSRAGEALWQSEIVPSCAVKEFDVNDGWFAWQAAAGREAFALAKKSKKAKKAE